MRLCDQDDTIGVTTTCDYVSQRGMSLCNTSLMLLQSLHRLHLQPRHAGGRWHVAVAAKKYRGVAKRELVWVHVA